MPGVAFAAEPIAVVVGPRSKTSSLDAAQLRRIFLGRITPSPDGGQFRPLNLEKGDSLRVAFDKQVLGYDPAEVERYWIDQRIRGNKAPRHVDSEVVPLLLQKVPGTISYLPASAAKHLKVVAIDGKLPGQAGYLLAG